MYGLRFSLVLLCATPLLLAQNSPERTLGTPLGNGDDVMFGQQPIGFSFPFAGSTYTDVHVCTNGYVTLSNGGVPAPGAADYTATTVELSSGSPRLCALWTDFVLDSANGANCYIDSSATRCTITWDRAVCYGNVTQFQLQMQLFPSGAVKCFYGPGVTNAATFSQAAAQGIAGASPGGGATLPSASDLSAGGSTVDNLVFEHFAVGAFDMAVQSLDLVPSSPTGWTYAAAPFANCAATSNYGQGCLQQNDSFYEQLTPAGFDLAGKTISMLRQSGGYLVLDAIPGAIVPPGGGAVQVAPGDDVSQTVTLSSPMPIAGGGTTSSLTICSNAHIALAATGNGNSVGPTVPTFLGWAQTVVGCIHDYDQTAPGSGMITFEDTGGIAYVTWNGVISWNSTSADTLQFQFDLLTGDIRIVFGAFNPAGNNYLVGYSVGGPSTNPGPSDISTAFATPVTIGDVTVGPGLALTANGLPVLGNAGFALDTSNVPNVVPLAFLFFGTAPLPGIDLGIIGAPDCRAYTNANLTSVTFAVALPAGTGTVPLPLPLNGGLAGALLACQSAAFTLANPLNLVTSNGTSVTLGF